MKKILLAFVTFIFLFQISFVSAFELKRFDGSEIKLDDIIGKGQWTLVMFWAHDCGVCRAEAPILSDFHKKRNDVDVIGISIDGAGKKDLAVKFLNDTQPLFTSYITEITLAAINYEVLTEEKFRGTPTFLLFKPDGELIGNNPGKLSIESLENFISRNAKS